MMTSGTPPRSLKNRERLLDGDIACKFLTAVLTLSSEHWSTARCSKPGPAGRASCDIDRENQRGFDDEALALRQSNMMRSATRVVAVLSAVIIEALIITKVVHTLG